MAKHNSDRVAAFKEISNQPQGRSGSGTPKLPGPVKSVKHNPTKSGGINRPLNRP